MAFTRKTWLWIIFSILGFCVLCVVALAGFGMYFVSKHFETKKVTGAEAIRIFDEVKASFNDDKPVYDIENRDRPRQLRNLTTMPTSTTQVEQMWVMAWDADQDRLVKISIPFWLLRLGRQKVDIGSGGFDFKRLQLDLKELQRVGPVVLVDHRAPNGERVFVWTR